MKHPLNVLAISYGRHLFDQDNAERARMEACAKVVETYQMIIFTHKNDALQTLTTESGLTLHPTNSKSKPYMIFDAVRIGLRLLRESGNWVITTQDPFEAGLVGWYLRLRTRVSLNVQEHGDFFSTPHWRRDTKLNRLRYIFGKWLLKRANTVRVVSKRIAKTLVGFGVSESKIHFLPVRTDAIVDCAPDNNLRDVFEPESCLVLTMARLENQKNLPLLIKAFAKAHAKVPALRLVVVGKGSQESSLKALVKELDLSKVVYFLPWTDAPQSLMKAADMYALSSNWEGWARVLVEAMAAGIPVVTTDVGCAGEVLLDGEHGFVVPVSNQDKFCERLIQLGSDDVLRKQFGAAGLAAVGHTHETLEQYAENWVKPLIATINL